MRFYSAVAVATGLSVVLGGCLFSSESSVETSASISTDETTGDEEQDVADEGQDASESAEADTPLRGYGGR